MLRKSGGEIVVNGLNIIGSNKALQDHWIKRIVAYIIDSIIVFVVSLIIVLVMGPFWGGFGGLFLGLGILVMGLIAILYWILQDGLMGGTIGKKVMGLQVVGTTGPMDIVKAVIRNVSKIYGLFLLLDWIVGLATEGDPRQKFTDRMAGCTVVRTDQMAYMEEQFRQMATPPPHPMAPTGYAPPQQGWGQQPPQQPPQQQWGQQPPQQQYQPAPAPGTAPPAQQAPPQQPPAQQTWPGQQPPQQQQAGWPQHQWNQQGQLLQTPHFCSNCGGPLVPRGDGRMVCSRCGTVY